MELLTHNPITIHKNKNKANHPPIPVPQEICITHNSTKACTKIHALKELMHQIPCVTTIASR